MIWRLHSSIETLAACTQPFFSLLSGPRVESFHINTSLISPSAVSEVYVVFSIRVLPLCPGRQQWQTEEWQ